MNLVDHSLSRLGRPTDWGLTDELVSESLRLASCVWSRTPRPGRCHSRAKSLIAILLLADSPKGRAEG